MLNGTLNIPRLIHNTIIIEELRKYVNIIEGLIIIAT